MAERGDAVRLGAATVADRLFRSAAGRIAFRYAIAGLAAIVASLACASLLAPRLTETLRPEAIQPDGEHAFVQGLSLEAPWPYVVPSRPDFVLAAGDTALTEDGAPIGGPEPSHAEIRRLGGGRYDFWQGMLWFSTPGSDPRDPPHTYAFSVATRLDGGVAAARYWCVVALLALLVVEVARRFDPDVLMHWGRRPGAAPRHAAALAGHPPAVAGTWLWNWRWPFRVAALALLTGLAGLGAREPVSLLYEPDSLDYIVPGLRLADGHTMAGTSVRDVGYPILAFLAVRLGSLADIVPIQFGMVMLAMACMLLVMEAFFGALLSDGGFAPGRVPAILAIGLSATAVLYGLLLFSHDGFVINIYALMAEAPHFLPMAMALLCLAVGWAAPSPRRRIILLALATDTAFLSTVIKPSSLAAFAVCAASLAAACVPHRRWLRAPAVIGALVLSLGFVMSLNRLDAWATARDDDFAAKVLFCNHLDVIDDSTEPATPERARIKALTAQVFSQGAQGWPLQGYNGDLCSFSREFIDAIAAAARSEGKSPRDWEAHEVVKAVLSHPLRYARHVGKQAVYFVTHPIADADQSRPGHVTDADWAQLVATGPMRQMSRDRFDVTVPNWFEALAPDLVGDLKAGLGLVASTFALVAGASTLFALWEVNRLRRGERLRAEAILLAVGAFTTALPVTVALSHTFDINRYSVDVLPFTVLWWCLALVYIARSLVRGVAWLRESRDA